MSLHLAALAFPLLAGAFQQTQVDPKKDSASRSDSAVQMGTSKSGKGHYKRDTTVIVRDSTDSATMARVRENHGYARRLPVTEQVLATAFRDPEARVLLARARMARLSQDSALEAYDAMAYQRISAG